MLPVRSRLHRARDIREVSRRGGRRTRHGLSVAMLTTADGTAPRATVIVNKSVGGAVARNRLRRQVRHGLIRMWDEIPTGARIVVRANAEAQTLAASTLDQSLTAAVHGAGAQAANRTRS